MGNVLASNDGSEIDDDVTILAFLQAEESIVLSELLAEEPVTGMKFRRVFPRPNYRDSVWWRMLEKGDCKIPGSREYKLFRRRLYRGAYIIADNGYAKWRMFQAPIKSSSSMEELKWSTRLESVRKDVECFFGRLKIRFRILRSRILFQKQGYIDNVFYASCIMHNMLLKDDGLD